MNTEEAKALRREFPPGTVGKLPKPYKRDSTKGPCRECGGYHGLPAAHLDYVGHAAVTDRLLSVDPAYTWEFAMLDEHGQPSLRHSIDPDGNLWIRLTACGVTRIGVGDGASMKERIGDAIRNAAMRFGVALDLWSKEELESGHVAEQGHDKRPVGTPAAEAPADPWLVVAGRFKSRAEAEAAAKEEGYDLSRDEDVAAYAALLGGAA